MIPEVNGKEILREEMYVFPRERFTYAGFGAFVEVLEDRLRKLSGYENLKAAEVEQPKAEALKPEPGEGKPLEGKTPEAEALKPEPGEKKPPEGKTPEAEALKPKSAERKSLEAEVLKPEPAKEKSPEGKPLETEAAPAADLTIQKDSQPAGAYLLQIAEDGIRIEAGDGAGVANALTTLYWRIREGKGGIRCGEIMDQPHYGYRGFLLDCSRHFFPVETVCEMIEQCALRKMNRLHWHLSDDQGYRIESRRFPRLNTVGSWRKEPDGQLYGGYYTWEQIGEVVEFARVRGMEIVPEIDLPGHVSALVAAYPELCCSREPLEVPTVFGVMTRILCVGRDEVIQFVEELLDEVTPLFPGEYFHIGGDEVPKEAWKNCPDCQARMRAEGLRDEEELQAWFTERILAHLKTRGKTGICWNETLKSGRLDASATIQYWAEEGEGENYCQEAFSSGRKCVYSNSAYLYLDYDPCLTPLRKVFAGDNRVKSGALIPEDSLLGWEGTLWAERITDRDRLERMAFPRLLAVAEKTWNPRTAYGDFADRCRRELLRMEEDGVPHFSMEEADPYGEEQIRAVVAQWKPSVRQLRTMGMDQMAGIIRGLIASKLEGQFTEEEIDGIWNEIVSEEEEKLDIK